MPYKTDNRLEITNDDYFCYREICRLLRLKKSKPFEFIIAEHGIFGLCYPSKKVN